MRIRDLVWLLRVAETGHVTDAAASLRTSQPTLSRALARAEEELGTALFVRSPDGVHPTPAGDLVVAAAAEVTARWARLTEDLATLLDPESGTVRLAFLDSLATSLVPRVLRDFHAHAPGTRVLLRQEPAHEIELDLASGAADLAITSPQPVDHGWLPLQRERLVLAVPPRHRLAGRARVRLADLGPDDELVTTPVGYGYRAVVDRLLREAGVSVRVSFESQELATIEGLVAAGLGVGIVPEQFAGTSGTVGVPISARGARRTIGLAWRRDRPLPPPAARFLDFLVPWADR